MNSLLLHVAWENIIRREPEQTDPRWTINVKYWLSLYSFVEMPNLLFYGSKKIDV